MRNYGSVLGHLKRCRFLGNSIRSDVLPKCLSFFVARKNPKQCLIFVYFSKCPPKLSSTDNYFNFCFSFIYSVFASACLRSFVFCFLPFSFLLLQWLSLLFNLIFCLSFPSFRALLLGAQQTMKH